MGKRRVLELGVGAALAAVACGGGAHPEAAPPPSAAISLPSKDPGAATSVPSLNAYRCGGDRQGVHFAHALLRNEIDDDRGSRRAVRRQVLLRGDGFVLFDAKSGNLAFPPPLPEERRGTASAILPDGQVLVVGGAVHPLPGSSPEAWLYDDTKGWLPAGRLGEPRTAATATLLQSGDVLITGGRRTHSGDATTYATRWLANERRFVEEPPMLSPRSSHSAVTLADGRVLIVGGARWDSAELTEVFDPVKHLFTPGPPLPQRLTGPAVAASPMGAVVVAGKGIFHLPADGTAWTTLSTEERPARQVVMLWDCLAFVTSRFGVEAYDLTTGTRVYEASPAIAREAPSLLRVDDRTVLLASGEGPPAIRSAESFTLTAEAAETPSFEWKLVNDSFAIEWTDRDAPELPFLSLGSKLWIGTPSPVDLLHGAATPLPGDGSLRSGATLTALGGKALLVGGVTLWDNARDDDPPRTSLQRMGKAFLFDAAKHTWRRTGQSPRARWDHVAVRLQDGSVAVIGGVDDTKGVLPMERWDPRTGSFRDLGRLRWPRIGHTATLLPNGSVLVTGGCDITVPVPHFEGSMVLPAPEANHSSELVRPGHADSTSSELGDSRCGHTAVLLGDGRVLVVGGFPDGASLLYGTVTQAPRRTATAAVWSPSTGQWTPAASMHADRAMPAALLLPDGRVLIAGGEPKEARRLTAEAYDPKTDSWSVVGVLPKLFERPSMALLGEGRVLLQEGWGVAIQLRVGERRTP